MQITDIKSHRAFENLMIYQNIMLKLNDNKTVFKPQTSVGTTQYRNLCLKHSN